MTEQRWCPREFRPRAVARGCVTIGDRKFLNRIPLYILVLSFLSRSHVSPQNRENRDLTVELCHVGILCFRILIYSLASTFTRETTCVCKSGAHSVVCGSATPPLLLLPKASKILFLNIYLENYFVTTPKGRF